MNISKIAFEELRLGTVSKYNRLQVLYLYKYTGTVLRYIGTLMCCLATDDFTIVTITYHCLQYSNIL